MAFLLFQAFAVEKCLQVDLLLEGALQAGEQAEVAGQQAGVDERRLDGQIVGRFLQAFFRRAHAMADGQADVPEQADQVFKGIGQCGIGRFRQQKQQVDVGIGIKLLPPVAADGN